MFDLAERIKKKYGVETVNFIDISCRRVQPPNHPRLDTFVRGTRRLLGLPPRSPPSSDLSDGSLSPVAQRASPDRPTIIIFDGREFEVHEVPAIRGIRTPDIPDGWIYGKFIDTDLAYYINEKDGSSISQSDWDGASVKKAKLTPKHPHSSQPWKDGGKPRRTFKNKNKRKSKCGKRCKGNNKSMRRSTMKQKHRRRNKY